MHETVWLHQTCEASRQEAVLKLVCSCSLAPTTPCSVRTERQMSEQRLPRSGPTGLMLPLRLFSFTTIIISVSGWLCAAVLQCSVQSEYTAEYLA